MSMSGTARVAERLPSTTRRSSSAFIDLHAAAIAAALAAGMRPSSDCARASADSNESMARTKAGAANAVSKEGRASVRAVRAPAIPASGREENRLALALQANFPVVLRLGRGRGDQRVEPGRVAQPRDERVAQRLVARREVHARTQWLQQAAREDA